MRRSTRAQIRAADCELISCSDCARAICASRPWSQNSGKFSLVASGCNEAQVNSEKKVDAVGQSAYQPVDWICHL